jgi:predicted nucleic acid-binding protein
MRPRLYIETSVVSYRVSRPSRDLLAAAHQQITREWWDNSLAEYELYISDIVIQEIQLGDPEAAQERLDLVSNCPVLALSTEAERLAALYLREMPLPPKAIRDALHMAIASLNGMAYLVTWNCRHIAQGRIKRRLLELNAREGIESPVICTPEELGGESDVE